MAGEMGRLVEYVDALELLRYMLEVKVWEIKGETWVFKPGRRGDVARGVAEGVRSSVSKEVSRGVMGRGIPGI